MKLATGVVLCLALSALAAPAPAQGPKIKLASRPTAADMLAAYPAKASAEGLAGRATLSCAVTRQGALAGCEARAETPEGYGFGAAALSLAAKITLDPAYLPERIDLPLRFDPPPRVVQPIFKVPGGWERNGPAGPYYPDIAVRSGANGAAVLQCTLLASGFLTDCDVLEDTPPKFFFGDAARVMASKHALMAAPRVVDGAPLASEAVQLEVRFELVRRR